ncbi:uncharacterized protein LOC120850684, partial [Ixodes scapularis]|uniref:uncharacterized protein LOC120850684 n=1 Tax=Ixodes scapularis TaxID=6945 RepID=UPI001C38C550
GLSGDGNTAVTMSPSVPLFVQVGARKFGFHSDHLCLLVLPCPHVVLDCLRECFSTAVLLLKLSGDVEENPGPITQEMFNEMIQTQKEILSKISEIQTKQASSEATMLQMQNRLLTIEKKLQRVDETETRLEKLEHSVGGCDAEIETLARQIDELENRSRRNNLIVGGIKEVSKETEEIFLKRVNDDVFDKILNNKLNSIERIHRLGKQVSGGDRPIMLKVSDFRDKLAILKNCFKLKGTPISISEDFSKRVVEIRKNLWDSTAEERGRGSKVKLVFDKLRVDNALYAWNEATNERFKCHEGPLETRIETTPGDENK